MHIYKHEYILSYIVIYILYSFLTFIFITNIISCVNVFNSDNISICVCNHQIKCYIDRVTVSLFFERN